MARCTLKSWRLVLTGVILMVVVRSSFAADCQSKFTVINDTGLTADGHFLNKSDSIGSAAECCSWAARDPRALVWTYHQKQHLCSYNDKPFPRSVPGAVSGTAVPLPPPSPQPPRPSPSPPSAICPATPPSPPAKTGSPNIVLFLTDDMDKLLGGWTPMRQASALLSAQGATATNWFIHTPVCCPSRGELLTGRYFHNIIVDNYPNDGASCMSVAAGSTFYNEWYFAPHLQQAGYTVGIFGKHLNSHNPVCPPPGVDMWLANGGGQYQNPSFSWASAGSKPDTVKFNNCTYGPCYSTSVIGNTSLAWVRSVLTEPKTTRKPFFAYIALKAPHIEDGPGWPITEPAPWYNQSSIFPNIKAPRTPNWNASCPDHHWLIRTQPPMTQEQADRSDALYRARWLSLLSVDDLVAETVATIDRASVLGNTYLLFSSDHGFRFGQFRMPEGKWNAYENDLRIPMVLKGPGIAPGSTFDHVASNVDTMPTILGLAGIPTPVSMDGRSLAGLLVNPNDPAVPLATAAYLKEPSVMSTVESWRSELLVEYYGLGNVVRYEHLEDTQNNTFRTLRIIDPTAPKGLQNAKYSEFVGSDNRNHSAPPLEYELFDLDTDPWEMKNIFSAASLTVKRDLAARVERLFRCQGRSCN